MDATGTYFGWDDFRHVEGCRTGKIEFQWRTDEKWRRNEIQVRARAVCPSCGSVVQIEATVAGSEDGYAVSTGHATTTEIGYGLPPMGKHGLYVWPGPVLWWGRHGNGEDAERGSYLVTTTPERPRQREDVVGAVYRVQTRRGAKRYGAVLGYDPTTRQGPEDCKRVAGAVRWIAAQLDAERPSGEAIEEG